MPDHQHATCVRGRGDGTFRIDDGLGERLLDEAVLARRQHRHGQVRVRGHRGRERDRVERDRRAGPAGPRVGSGEDRRDPVARSLGGVAAPAQLGTRQRREVRAIFGPQ